MTAHASGSFEIEAWDEQPYVEIEGGGKLTRAEVRQAISGDIAGEGEVQWLMCYREDQTADFVGLQRIVGQLGGRTGSFVLVQTEGTFDGKEARGKLSVVPDSGTGDLRSLRGSGSFSAPHGSPASIALDYELD